MEDKHFQYWLVSTENSCFISDSTTSCVQKAKSCWRDISSWKSTVRNDFRRCRQDLDTDVISQTNPNEHTHFSTFASLPPRSMLFSKPTKLAFHSCKGSDTGRTMWAACISNNSIRCCPAVCTGGNWAASSPRAVIWALGMHVLWHGAEGRHRHSSQPNATSHSLLSSQTGPTYVLLKST